jgi:hypothetical protein
MTTLVTPATDWKLVLGDDATWAMLPSRLDLADSALLWLTNTIEDVDRQLTDAKADVADAGRMSSDAWADLQAWRASALGFKRICERRKRELVPAIKAARHNQRDHAGDAAWKWDHLVQREDLNAEDAFIRGFILGRTT